MNGIQRPMSDPIWDKIYPPNGWNCRCTVIATTGAATPDKQIRMPWDVPPLFQTNLAKTGMLWPKDHPYFKAVPGPTAKRMEEESDDRYITSVLNEAVLQAQNNGRNADTALHSVSYKVAKDVVSQTIGFDSELAIDQDRQYGTGKIRVTRRSLRYAFRSGEHSRYSHHKLALIHVLRNPNEIHFTAHGPLGLGKNIDLDKDKRNIAKKEQEGIVSYNYYNFEYKGNPYTLHLQVHEDGYELIYGVYSGYDRYRKE